MYRAGIIGVGQIGYKIDFDKSRKFIWSHAKTYKSHNETTLVAVSDARESAFDDFNSIYKGVAFYKSYVDMVEKSRIDFVSILQW